MNRHYRMVVAVLLGWIVGSGALPAAENVTSWKALKPNQAPNPVKTVIMGKQLNYYLLEKGKDLSVTIQGPTTLRILSRLEFGTKEGGEKRYYLRYERDDGKTGKFRRSASPSSNAALAGNSTVKLSTSREMFLTVPAGKHVYRFSVGDKAAYRLYLRFYEPAAEVGGASENVAFLPTKFTTEVPLIIKEEQTSYYRLGPQDSLKLNVIGPTTIQVLARLEFDPTMLADQKFRLRAYEDQKEKQIFALRSKPSEIAEYQAKSAKKLGQAAKFYIEVPRGKHEYKFDIVDNGRTVLLRFFLPKKDLTNNL